MSLVHEIFQFLINSYLDVPLMDAVIVVGITRVRLCITHCALQESVFLAYCQSSYVLRSKGVRPRRILLELIRIAYYRGLLS
jgi:hypothetical protein